jgi:heparin/heparan-sulfate lyase
MLFQIWTTYPNGWLWKDGDVWSGAHTDKSKFRMQIDAIAGMHDSGVGRAFALQMADRWPKWDGWPSDYHTVYLWQFFVFNDPTLKAEPLSTLGRADVFSPKLHGIVCWRDSWEADATVIHFKCGETVDHHATYDQGKFTIFKRTPLAIKDGAYIGYGSSHHRYYKSPWSANCVVFTGEKSSGEQPHIDFDGAASWKAWKAKRDARYKRPPTGVLLATEANERYTRALGDLTGACPAGSYWTRELVFLGYRYLLVLDRVRAAEGFEHRWLLQTINEPKVERDLAVADNAPGRLFCRTLLPEEATITKVGGPGHEFDYNGHNRLPKGWPDPKRFPPEMQLGKWRLEVTPSDGSSECVYLHVLFPADTKTYSVPKTTVRRDARRLTVTVGGLSYGFGK